MKNILYLCSVKAIQSKPKLVLTLWDKENKTTKIMNNPYQTLVFDVMLNDRYVCTMRYRHLSAFAITEKEIVDYVISQRPSLKDKPFIIAF